MMSECLASSIFFSTTFVKKEFLKKIKKISRKNTETRSFNCHLLLVIFSTHYIVYESSFEGVKCFFIVFLTIFRLNVFCHLNFIIFTKFRKLLQILRIIHPCYSKNIFYLFTKVIRTNLKMSS